MTVGIEPTEGGDPEQLMRLSLTVVTIVWWMQKDSNLHGTKTSDLQSGEPANCSMHPYLIHGYGVNLELHPDNSRLSVISPIVIRIRINFRK